MIPRRKSSILVLYCGGTIGMRQDPTTSSLRPSLTVKDLIDFAPLLRDEIKLQSKTVTNIDSTDIQPHHWVEIAKEISREYSHYDGFVVLHGTDTMVYTASALSYALGNLGKPVIITGSQVPAELLGSDAIINLINAAQAATMDMAEVAILFGTKILRGNRAIKVSESARDAIISPVFPQIGGVNLQPEITMQNAKRRHGGRLHLSNSFEGNIAAIQIVPGLDPSVLEAVIDSGVEGIILESFGPGNVPSQENSLLDAIKRAIDKKIPVLISTQCIYGSTRMYLYESGTKAAQLGVIPTRDMTPESAFVKLKWALGQTKSMSKIRQIFDQDIAGEVTIS